MRKQTKKLAFHTEMVRLLDREALSVVNGGTGGIGEAEGRETAAYKYAFKYSNSEGVSCEMDKCGG